jgi:hypothetical protein
MPELDVETRLATLEAKEEVRAFIAAYCAICDRTDKIGDLVDLFTEDAVLRNPAGVHSGREAIESYYAAFFADGVKFSRHHAMNQVITILEPGAARLSRTSSRCSAVAANPKSPSGGTWTSW